MKAPTRVLIIGTPRSGKTTKARELAAAHTDAVYLPTDELLAKYEWSELSEHVANRLEAPGEFILEGCSAVRGLRKYLRRRQEKGDMSKELPFVVIWMDKPFETQTPKQAAFGKGCYKIYQECLQMIREMK